MAKLTREVAILVAGSKRFVKYGLSRLLFSVKEASKALPTGLVSAWYSSTVVIESDSAW
jgi:hypothetical protein